VLDGGASTECCGSKLTREEATIEREGRRAAAAGESR
jgi:hypothetical protein